MKKRMLPLFVAMCLILTGCGLFDGSYLSITPHEEQTHYTQTEVVSAYNYRQLQKAVEDMVASGSDNYRLIRILSFVNPALVDESATYQVNNSKIAIGSGGLYGRGTFVQGAFSQLDYVPEDWTDFILPPSARPSASSAASWLSSFTCSSFCACST